MNVSEKDVRMKAANGEASPGSLRILFVTTQWSEADGAKGAPFVGREIEALRARGLDVDVFTYTGGWSLWAYLRAIRLLRARLKQAHYDIVHVRFGQCGLVGRAQWKVPVVITYGGSDVQGALSDSVSMRLKVIMLRSVSWVVSLLADEVIVVARHLGEKLPRRTFHVIPSGIDFVLFRPIDRQQARAQLALPPGQTAGAFRRQPRNSPETISPGPTGFRTRSGVSRC